jgi:hypothetical protein
MSYFVWMSLADVCNPKASCGGFPGISDSFGAALWGVDYALQMAYSNFSEGLFHVGGQSDYYNVGGRF